MQPTTTPPNKPRTAINAVQKEDLPIHGWYRFVLSYPPHLVRQYISEFGMTGRDLVLDPFCGTGTTLVEARKRGIPSVGSDAHPFAALVSRVKTNWQLDPKLLKHHLSRILCRGESLMLKHGLASLSMDAKLFQELGKADRNGYGLTENEEKLLPTGFLSHRPLQRLLMLRDEIEAEVERRPPAYREFFLVSLSSVVATGAGNFAFGPEIYRTKPKSDYDVLGHFARHTHQMVAELTKIRMAIPDPPRCEVFVTDARDLAKIPGDISAVITSPPYPNEKDYTRTTRVESIIVGFLRDRQSLRQVKESLLRSNTRNVFVEDSDADEVKGFRSIQGVCQQIEQRRIELNKDSGFERLYHKVVAHYFGGMCRHLRALRPKLRRGARLAYVVGDQLSFLMVPVATARLLAEVAEAEGYKTIGCALWRERVGTKVRNSRTNEKTVRVREEILLLQRD
ncbi:MAG: site-specific DNA-methyltransferase [Verrucomicrobiales bacterium]|nr:site-specific DNA-methyltransferase [Verrucomicrobiales bacterium]